MFMLFTSSKIIKLKILNWLRWDEVPGAAFLGLRSMLSP